MIVTQLREIVQSVKRGAYTAHVIDRNAPPRNYGVAESIRYMVRLDYKTGAIATWPARSIESGQVRYERKPSRDARRATEAAYRIIDAMLGN